jgi:predicted small secreted protein
VNKQSHAADRHRRRARIALIMVAACGPVITGCNTSRYGRGYDQQLPRICHVAVLPMVEVSALHTGGLPEPPERERVRRRMCFGAQKRRI